MLVIRAVFEVADQTAYALEIPVDDLGAVQSCLSGYIVGEVEPRAVRGRGAQRNGGAERPKLRTRIYRDSPPPSLDEIENMVRFTGGSTTAVAWARKTYMAGNIVKARSELERAVAGGRLIYRATREPGRAAREEYVTAHYAAKNPVDADHLIEARSGEASAGPE